MESAANVLNIVDEVTNNSHLIAAAEAAGYLLDGAWFVDRTSSGKAWELVRRVEGDLHLIGTFETAADALRVIAIMRACEIEFMAGRCEDIGPLEWDDLSAWYAHNRARGGHYPYTAFVRSVLNGVRDFCALQARTWGNLGDRIN